MMDTTTENRMPEYEQNVQEESASVNTEKQTKFMEESKERMSKICTQIAYLEKIAGKRSVDYTKENVDAKKHSWNDLKIRMMIIGLILIFKERNRLEWSLLGLQDRLIQWVDW